MKLVSEIQDLEFRLTAAQAIAELESPELVPLNDAFVDMALRGDFHAVKGGQLDSPVLQRVVEINTMFRERAYEAFDETATRAFYSDLFRNAGVRVTVRFSS